MKKEVDKAVETFHKIAFGTGKKGRQIISDEQLASFVVVLTELLMVRYKNNWYPENPTRGSGYRCLRINSQCMDPTIMDSFIKSNISVNNKLRAMELTIWVDPGVVSIRIGEEGSIGTEDVEMDPLPPRKDSTSEDEAYASRSPSPIASPKTVATPKLNNQRNVPPPSSSSLPVSSNNTPKVLRGAIYQQRVSPPSSMPVVHPNHPAAVMVSSQDLMASHGHIPAPQYSRPRALFPNHENGNYQFHGHYNEGMMGVPLSRVYSRPNMMHQGNYMDIPAQA